MKTIVFENDDWFWSGFADFLETIDPNYHKFNSEIRDAWDAQNQTANCLMMLSQPFVETVVTNSAFETQIFLDEKMQYQIDIYLNAIDKVLRFREKMNYQPLTFIICYNGEDFLEDVNRERWGGSFKNTLNRVVRQNPESFSLMVYNRDFQFMKKVEEADFS